MNPVCTRCGKRRHKPEQPACVRCRRRERRIDPEYLAALRRLMAQWRELANARG